MRTHTLLFMSLLLFSCSEHKSEEGVTNEQAVPQVYTVKSSLKITIKNGIVFCSDKKYTGFLYELYPGTKDTFSVEGYCNGALQGICKKWYPNKQLLEERFYRQGEKDGKQVSFWENGYKKFDFTAKKDSYEGEMREWNVDGKLIHLATFVNGQEEGTQKLWYDNGKIRANYVIINGKRFGLLGTKNCRNVSDSIWNINFRNTTKNRGYRRSLQQKIRITAK